MDTDANTLLIQAERWRVCVWYALSKLLALPGAGVMGGIAVPDSERRKCAPLLPLGDCGSRESDETLSDLVLAESDWPSLPAEATGVRRGDTGGQKCME